MGSVTEATLLLLLLLAAFPAVFAVIFQVGDSNGWASGVNYTTWVGGKTFRVGDTLEFKYGPSHSVSVVSKADYDGCDSSRPTASFSDGDSKINLTTIGDKHFICPTFGHCLGGMKLAVSVFKKSSSLAPSPSPSAPSPSPSPETARNMKNAASRRIISYGKIGVTMVFMFGLITFG